MPRILTFRDIVFILAVILIALLSFMVGRAQGTSRVVGHYEYDDDYFKIRTYCDTGNGAMLYITQPFGIAAVPNGCTKQESK